MRAARPRWGCLALAAGLVATGCSSGPIIPDDPSGGASAKQVSRSDEPTLLLVAGPDGVTQAGSAEVFVDVVSLAGGDIAITDLAEDHAQAIRFPRFRETGRYPRAVVRVRNAGQRDEMDPRRKDFSWGAELRLDRRSGGTVADNGDNLVQRGLFSDPTFFKAEVDDRRASCTVTGDEGSVIVHASRKLRPDLWYRVRCERVGDELAIFVTEFRADGSQDSFASRVNGPIGDVDIADSTTPVMVGGKLGLDGKVLRNASDQFNGVVANPFLDVG